MNEKPDKQIQAPTSGRKRTSIALVSLVIVAISGFAYLLLPREPYYNGKSLNYWLARSRRAVK